MSFNEVNQSTGDLEQLAGSFSDTVYADAPVGAIQAFGGSTAPSGWLLCNGAAVSRTTYSDLFAVIGTRYGSGDGSTTFNLPSKEAGAAVYPTEEGNVLSDSNYIIKAIKTAVPADFQTEIDAINEDLTANNNKFIFAYDSTSQSYGYKAGGADTFHPFSAGSNFDFSNRTRVVNGVQTGSYTVTAPGYILAANNGTIAGITIKKNNTNITDILDLGWGVRQTIFEVETGDVITYTSQEGSWVWVIYLITEN